VGSTAEYDLAWDLAAAVDSALTAADRSAVFAKIGAGETYGAIGHLLASAQHRGAALGPDLLRRVQTWLNAYAGCEEEPNLRAMLTLLGPQRPH
jgi:hypothetical protein